MNDIMRALAAGEDPDTVVDRETLRYAVQRQITCKQSGVVLDLATAVLVTVTTPDKRACEVIDGKVWDAMADTFRAECAKVDITLEVIDGRTL